MARFSGLNALGQPQGCTFITNTPLCSAPLARQLTIGTV